MFILTQNKNGEDFYTDAELTAEVINSFPPNSFTITQERKVYYKKDNSNTLQYLLTLNDIVPGDVKVSDLSMGESNLNELLMN